MMLKFLKHGTGDGREASKYVLETSKSFEKEVLFGSGEMFDAVTNSLEFVHRYRSAVIGWELEDQPTSDQIKETLDKFFDIAFAGLDRDRFSPLAVLHTGEDGRKDMHILIPRVDLETGLSFNPAPPGWQKMYDPMRDMLNYQYDWARPDDEQRKKELSLGKPEKIDRKDGKEQITAWLKDRIDNGLVKNRADVLVSLSEIGEVTRAGKDYVSVKLPDFEKPLRLKGGIYEQQFNAIIERKIETENIGRCGVNPEEQRRRFESAQRSFTEVVERVSRFNRRKYERDGTRFDRQSETRIEPGVNNFVNAGADNCIKLGFDSIPIEPDFRQLETDRKTESDNNRKPKDNTRTVERVQSYERKNRSIRKSKPEEKEVNNDTNRNAIDAIIERVNNISRATKRIAIGAINAINDYARERARTTASIERASFRIREKNQQLDDYIIKKYTDLNTKKEQNNLAVESKEIETKKQKSKGFDMGM